MKASDFYFNIMNPTTGLIPGQKPFPYVVVTNKVIFDTENRLDGEADADLIVPSYFGRLMENCFEVPVTMHKHLAVLKLELEDKGFIYNPNVIG